MDHNRLNLLRLIPGIDRILLFIKEDSFFSDMPKSLVTRSCRRVVEDLRKGVLDKNPEITEESLSMTAIADLIKKHIKELLNPNLIRLINATGVVVHTNLGRSVLAPSALENISLISGGYSNLEFNLEQGKRGLRYSAIEDILCELTGAEAAMAVNNNAGAVLLCLETVASGKEVIVSRGELVEIGGSFRIPDVMAKSRAILHEVGTTNRTHLRDYEGAINENTGLLLKVHTSNFSVVGFTACVSLKELSEVGRKYSLPVMEDLGSGTLIDLSRYGMVKEPTVQESLASGADIVTFSGDKLLGGPQAGIIAGKKKYLDMIKKNPLTRALRIDKMTLAALESTLQIYRDPEKAVFTIPTLKMLTSPVEKISAKAEKFMEELKKLNDSSLTANLLDLPSKVGGGALPLQDLPSKCVGMKIAGMTANYMEKQMRENSPPIIGRIEADLFIADFRTIRENEIPVLVMAVKNLLKRDGK